MGRILSTTNVGARVNLRHYLSPPVVKIKPGTMQNAVATACQELAREFEPFRKTPTGRPRKQIVLVAFAKQTSPEQRAAILQGIRKAMAGRTFCDGGKNIGLGNTGNACARAPDWPRPRLRSISRAASDSRRSL